MRARLAFLTLMALGLAAPAAFSDELKGRLSKVNIDDKSITVVENGTNKEVVVKINARTQMAVAKKARHVDLAKVKERVEKRIKKGINIEVTHENGIASKIELDRKKGK